MSRGLTLCYNGRALSTRSRMVQMALHLTARVCNNWCTRYHGRVNEPTLDNSPYWSRSEQANHCVCRSLS